MSYSSHPRRSALAFVALLLGLMLTAGDCQPVDDDDSSVEPVESRVSIQGGATYETIQEAIDAASPGAVIEVTAGLYDESLTITKPLTLFGPEPQVNPDDPLQLLLPTAIVTGAGDGTIVEVDQVVGTLTISTLGFVAPYDELGTVRAFRITDSTDVQLNRLRVGFDPDEGECDHGLSGLEVSRSGVLFVDSDLYCVGFTSENGGTGILAQTDSTLTVQDSRIMFVGSYGIHVADTELTINDSEITYVNRPANAGQYERDGTGLYVEEGSIGAVIDGLTATDGVLAGILVDQAPGLTVNASTFTTWNYGVVFLGGDAAAAGNRYVSVTASTFVDQRQEATLIVASATVTGNTVENINLEPVPFGFPVAGGLTVQAPGGTVDVSGNVVTNVGLRGIGVLGSAADGDVLEATVVGNTVTGVLSGNGLDLQAIEQVTATDNVVTGVDYFTDPANEGVVSNGFGIDCFNTAACNLERNEVTDAEFGAYVIVGSGFSSTDDVAIGGLSRGWHIESSQGTLTDTTVTGVLGYGLLALDSTIQGTGGTISGSLRGPFLSDIDGIDDPEEPWYYTGGEALYVSSIGAPTYLSWEGGLFEDNIDGGVSVYDAQIQLVGNTLRNNGFIDEADPTMSPGYPVYIGGYDTDSITGPLIEDNIIDGGVGSWGVYMWNVPGARIYDNTICAGDISGLYIREADGAEIRGNSIGTTEDASITSCADIDWSYGLYMGNSTVESAVLGMSAHDNIIAPPVVQYGVYVSGMGAFDLEENTITGGTQSGLYATMTMPATFTSDQDADGTAEYNGDCNDDDATIGGAGQVEIAGDLKDNDCDGVADDGLSTADEDGDGTSIADGDCNDDNAAIHPAAAEVIGNLFDDDCDGWADLDAPLPAPTLSMRGNTISGGQKGIFLAGATADLADPDVGDLPNSITDTLGAGLYLSSWVWYGTPAGTEGTATVGSETVFGPTGGPCAQLAGDGTVLVVDGATLTDCGTTGVEMSMAGTVSLLGATIEDPGAAGVYAYNGLVEASAGTAINGAGASGMQLDGSAVAAFDGVTITDSFSSGLAIGGAAVTLGGVGITGSGASGINMTAGVLEADDGLVVTASTLAGVAAVAGTVDLTGSTIGTSGGNGLDLSGSVSATIEDVVLQDALEYGLLCDGGVADPNTSTVTLDLCTATVSGNTLGDFELINGCEIEWSCTEL
jgi:hypothetical protein